MRNAPKKTVLFTALAIGLLVVLFVVPELVLRHYYYSRVFSNWWRGESFMFEGRGASYDLLRVEPDPQLLWRYKKNLRIRLSIASPYSATAYQFLLETNSLGYVGEEVPRKKAPSTLRVLCMGGSSTMGYGVGWRSAYCNLLVDMLNSHGVKSDGINAGVEAYTSFQGSELIKELVPFSPDLVVVSYDYNDTRRCHPSLVMSYRQRNLSPGLVRFQRLLNRSVLYIQLKLLVLALRGPAPHPEPETTFVVPPEEYRRNILEIVREARKAEAEVILFALGYVSEKENTRRLVQTPFFPILKSIAEKQNVPLLDATELSLNPAEDYFIDDCHPNEEGHRAIARALFELVQSSGILTNYR